MPRKPKIAVIGAGSLACSLVPALVDAGYSIPQVVRRDSPESGQRARALARKIGARVASPQAEITAELLWFCVPDSEIRPAAASLARIAESPVRFAFHSSGALSSLELAVLRKQGIAVASVHPLMTFVAGSRPSLGGVPFALEGDASAVRLARSIVRDLGGKAFAISQRRKPAYHMWATMTSPLLLAFLVTIEDAATLAGLSRAEARRKSLPIIRQTLKNYAELGPRHSFSGPIIRGDAETIARHLNALAKDRTVKSAYLALAWSALRTLPVKNRRALERVFREVPS